MRFENFIVDESNEFAYKVSLAVAETPCIYNPLIICGASGYGKTHLINAIYCVMEEKHGLRVVVLECNELLETFATMVKRDKCIEFYDWFKDFDVVIIENIQDLRGKQASQYEVARMIHRAVQDNKQVVCTSTKSINETLFKELRGFLKSRCLCMLEANIEIPSYKLKKQYLEYLIKMEDVELHEDQQKMIISYTSTVHQIRMVIKQAKLYSRIKKCEINSEILLLMLKKEQGGKKNENFY